MEKVELLCRVCGDKASGKHYGVTSCDGCRGFFKRSIRRNLDYVCKETNSCIVDVTRRNQCQACRFKKCLFVNMKRDAVQHERAPRCAPGKPRLNAPFFSPPLFLYPPFLPQHPPMMPRFPLPPKKEEEEEVTSTGEEGTRPKPQHPLTLNLYGETVNETAAKLLFMSVKWARSVPSFLGVRDQAVLLEGSWSELFVLSASQWGFSFDPVALASSVFGIRRDETLLEKGRLLRETLERTNSVHPDHTELACLKALVLFKPESKPLIDALQVELLQDQTQLMLQEYCLSNHPLRKNRFGKLLLLLPNLRRIDAKTLEDLFFKETIGDVRIERLLDDLVRGGSLF